MLSNETPIADMQARLARVEADAAGNVDELKRQLADMTRKRELALEQLTQAHDNAAATIAAERARCVQLQAALEFYADPNVHFDGCRENGMSRAQEDSGAQARAALASASSAAGDAVRKAGRALLAAERNGQVIGWRDRLVPTCPVCYQVTELGHTPECQLGQALALLHEHFPGLIGRGV